MPIPSIGVSKSTQMKMKSNHQERLLSEKALDKLGALEASNVNAKSIIYSDCNAGDQLYFSIPANLGENARVWGYAIKGKIKPDFIPVVVDELIVMNRNP